METQLLDNVQSRSKRNFKDIFHLRRSNPVADSKLQQLLEIQEHNQLSPYGKDLLDTCITYRRNVSKNKWSRQHKTDVRKFMDYRLQQQNFYKKHIHPVLKDLVKTKYASMTREGSRYLGTSSKKQHLYDPAMLTEMSKWAECNVKIHYVKANDNFNDLYMEWSC